MSWIAHYVEMSSHQQQEEYARRFAHRRPRVAGSGRVAAPPPARRHWWHVRVQRALEGTGHWVLRPRRYHASR